MEYGIAIGITIIFALLYMLTRTKSRERFTKRLSDDEFALQAKELSIINGGLPSKHGKKIYDVKPFVRTINRAVRKTKNSNIKTKNDNIEELNDFNKLITNAKKEIKRLNKKDFSQLNDLPSVNSYYKLTEIGSSLHNTDTNKSTRKTKIDNTAYQCVKNSGARIETIIRFVLSSGEYEFKPERIASVVEEYNKKHTLTFIEIEKMRLMTEYLMLEKLSYLSTRISAIVKLRKLSIKIARKPKTYEQSPIYKEICKNKLFIYFCAQARGEECPKEAVSAFKGVINQIVTASQQIIAQLKTENALYFSSLYAPLEILNTFEVFNQCSNEAKVRFLSDLCVQSDTINLDEYAYTYSLALFLLRTKPPKQTGKCIQIGRYKEVYSFCTNNNMLKLARALSSVEYMSLYYESKRKNNESVLKNVQFGNTSAVFRRNCSVDLGISISENKLSLKPSLPASVSRVEFLIEHNGITHIIKVFKSNDNTPYFKVNGTYLEGIPSVRLADKPLIIEIGTANGK